MLLIFYYLQSNFTKILIKLLKIIYKKTEYVELNKINPCDTIKFSVFLIVSNENEWKTQKR